jgi:hypothetical protein
MNEVPLRKRLFGHGSALYIDNAEFLGLLVFPYVLTRLAGIYLFDWHPLDWIGLAVILVLDSVASARIIEDGAYSRSSPFDHAVVLFCVAALFTACALPFFGVSLPAEPLVRLFK